MSSVEPLLIVLVATAAAVLAFLLLLTVSGRGPAARHVVAQVMRHERATREAAAAPTAGLAIASSVQLLVRRRRGRPGVDSAPVSDRDSSDELDEVLQGTMHAESINRTIRILGYAFILIALAVISLSQLWQQVQPEIFAILMAAGLLVLGVHEIFPATGLSSGRVLLEGSAAITFLTALILLTGQATSPFLFVVALMVGAVSLVSSKRVTLALALEAVGAYTVAFLAGPLEGAAARDGLARIAVNLTALVAMSWAGLAIAAAQRHTREAAIRLSTTDSLTGLGNRAYFFNVVEREIQRSRRFGREFCLLMMDLDGLKSINDRFGHYQGDLVLRGVAHVIRSALRGVDLAARYGGDEFVALLPETDPSGAFVVAEKIRSGAIEMVVESEGQTVRTSLSTGVVTYPADGRTADELLIAADQAMYAAKQLGKNRVVGYGDPGEATSPPVVRRREMVSGPEPARNQRRETDVGPGRSVRPRFRPILRDVDVLADLPPRPYREPNDPGGPAGPETRSAPAQHRGK